MFFSVESSSEQFSGCCHNLHSRLIPDIALVVLHQVQIFIQLRPRSRRSRLNNDKRWHIREFFPSIKREKSTDCDLSKREREAIKLQVWSTWACLMMIRKAIYVFAYHVLMRATTSVNDESKKSLSDIVSTFALSHVPINKHVEQQYCRRGSSRHQQSRESNKSDGRIFNYSPLIGAGQESTAARTCFPCTVLSYAR